MSNRSDKPDPNGGVPMEGELLEQRIRTLAYYMWESEGRKTGRADEYYHRARRQLIAETGHGKASDGSPDERSEKK